MNHFHALNVTKTVLHPEINAKTIFFSIVKDKSAQYIWQDYNGVKIYMDFPPELRWKAGQYLPIHIEIGDEIFSGRYPITAVPGNSLPLQTTVIKDLEDPVSEYLVDYIHLGDALKISQPSNEFYVEPDASQEKHYYFFASHSGILSVYTMAQSIIATEPNSYVSLLYICENEDKWLLKNELQQLGTAQHMHLSYFLFEKGNTPCWQSGTLDSRVIQQFLTENPPKHQAANYYIATDNAIQKTITTVLVGKGIAEKNIQCNDLNTCL